MDEKKEMMRKVQSFDKRNNLAFGGLLVGTSVYLLQFNPDIFDLVVLVLCIGFMMVCIWDVCLHKDDFSLYSLIQGLIFLGAANLLWILYLRYKVVEFRTIFYYVGLFEETVLLFSFVCILSVFISKVKTIQKIQISKFISDNCVLFLVLLLFVLFSIPQMDVFMTNDSSIYYIGVVNAREGWNFYDLSYLNLGAHGGYSYGLMTLLGDLMLPHTTKGIVLVNIFFAVFTIVSFYNILIKICSGISRYEAALFTAIFAFSPFVYGMIGDINLEFPQLCLFVILFEGTVYERKWLKRVAGILLCFTKETALLIFALFCFGELIYYSIFEHKEYSIFKRLYLAFSERMAFEFFIGLICVTLQLIVSVGSNEMLNTTIDGREEVVAHILNTFQVWGEYIIYKIYQIFLFNWTWILSFLIVLLVIINVKRLIKRIPTFMENHIGSLLFSYFGFLFFQFFYVTWTNHRYIIPVWIYHSVFFTLVVYYSIRKKIYRLGVVIISLGILVVSNYCTVDPITLSRFINRDEGNGKIAIMSFFSLDCLNVISDNIVEIYRISNEIDAKYSGTRDCLLYNRQSSYQGRVWNQILTDINPDDKTLLIVPNLLYNSEATVRSVLDRDVYFLDQFYWNSSDQISNINIYRDWLFYEDWIRKYKEIGYEKINIIVADSLKEVKECYGEQYENLFCVVPRINSDYDIEKFMGECNFSFKDTYSKNIFVTDLYIID